MSLDLFGLILLELPVLLGYGFCFLKQNREAFNYHLFIFFFFASFSLFWDVYNENVVILDGVAEFC